MKLIDDVAGDLSDVEVRRPRVVVQVGRVRAEADEDVFEAIRTADASVAIDLEGRFPLPNIVAVIENLMEATTPPMRIGRRTILAILKKLPAPERVLANPHEFAAAMVRAIKTRLADQLVDGITYERDGTWYDQRQFDDLIEDFADNVVPSIEVGGSGGTHLYDGVIADSETVERPFAEALEKDDRIKLYVKLPEWFKVPTPIGTYNPDWAIVFDDGAEEHLYLVRETKGTIHIPDLNPAERRKVLCGRKHFRDALGVDYRVVTDAGQLPYGGT
ncbi:MAG: hypothetical protein GC147_08705 [Porphyrobacter sp.]|nr:hypothetical protein [Porphyrobacter sp.]